MKTKLISADMVKMVKHAVKGKSFNLVKYDTDKYMIFCIGKVKVTKGENEKKPILDLEEGFTKDYGKLWYNDVGKVLARELHKDDPLLYVFSTNQFKALLKRIDEEKDDVDWLAERGLVHVKIGDFDYTILRIVSRDGDFSRKDKNNDYYIDIEIQEALKKERGEEAEDGVEHIPIEVVSNQSVQLF